MLYLAARVLILVGVSVEVAAKLLLVVLFLGVPKISMSVDSLISEEMEAFLVRPPFNVSETILSMVAVLLLVFLVGWLLLMLPVSLSEEFGEYLLFILLLRRNGEFTVEGMLSFWIRIRPVATTHKTIRKLNCLNQDNIKIISESKSSDNNIHFWILAILCMFMYI